MLLQREAGKTLDDCIAEVREAADFCRYYAAQARDGLAPRALPGPTGESNELRYRGRGAIVWDGPITADRDTDLVTARAEWAARLSAVTRRAEAMV